MKKVEYKVKPIEVGQRLDVVVAENFPEFSRAQWQSQLRSNPALIQGKHVPMNYRLKSEQTIILLLPTIIQSKPVLKVPEQLPEVLYEDNDVIVINKPAGLLTHPSERSDTPSVAAAFSYKVKDSDKLRPGIVHRLDKDTSGVMILAKTPLAKEFLQSQFKERKVVKEYIALLDGSLANTSARIELPLARSKKRPNAMVVSQTGKKAVSEYQVIAEYPHNSLVHINLLTGRTHQIRVQFAHIDHPVVGDDIYNHSKANPPINRQFLHSKSLTLTLPNGEKKTFTAELPDDLAMYLEQL